MPNQAHSHLPAAPVFELSAAEGDPASSVRKFLASRTQWFEDALDSGSDPLEIASANSAMIDCVVRELFDLATNDIGRQELQFTAVMALGGYGRRAMGPASDVDLLFLVEPGAAEHAAAITDGILYPLWDGGMEAGGATRTLADCASAMDHDARALTAMMDARLIGGNQLLAERLGSLLSSHFKRLAARRRFAELKISEQKERLSRTSISGSALQPNVKDGIGGLREFDTLLWVAACVHFGEGRDELVKRYIPDASGREAIYSALKFLWAVRHALHLSQGTRSDRLSEGVQTEVAARLGIKSDVDGSAAERFMTVYHRHAAALHDGCARAVELAWRELAPVKPVVSFLKRRRLGHGIIRTEYDTLALAEKIHTEAGEIVSLNLFAESRRRGIPVDPAAQAAVSVFEKRLNESVRSSSDAAKLLRDIFSDVKNLDRTLAQMQECGALERWFPEMGPMLHRVQRDGFHYYTAGVHSIRAVGEICFLATREGRRNFAVPARALANIGRQRVLALATLFHDVGKGRGVDHSEKGAELARSIALRMGLSAQDAADIEFLVRTHLLMATIAFKRDVRDPAMIERFAQSFRAPELLDMLYLLTFADLRAVGPHAWSDWKGGLLSELYLRTRDRLSPGGIRAERLCRDEARLIKTIHRSLGRDENESSIRDFLSKMPERYTHYTSPEAIAAHIMMSRELDSAPVATLVRDVAERSCTEFSIVTRDAPGLFAKIAGVLSANGANIVDAELCTANDGLAVDVLWVTDPLYKSFDDPESRSRIRSELSDAISGRRRIEEIVGGRFRRRFLSSSQNRRPTEIVIDNGVSAIHTVVEIMADDRRGLLYTIASIFHELGCSIDLARITTHVDRVIDVFYIRDAQGKKIDNRDRQTEIRRRLMEAVEE